MPTRTVTCLSFVAEEMLAASLVAATMRGEFGGSGHSDLTAAAGAPAGVNPGGQATRHRLRARAGGPACRRRTHSLLRSIRSSRRQCGTTVSSSESVDLPG